MYSNKHIKQQKIEEFMTGFNIELNKENRWIKMSEIVPWEEIEERYARTFKNKRTDGRRAISAREALGALLIQQMMKLTDVETVEMIAENPYMQYFLGYSEFKLEKPFDASSMVHFRKRISVENIIMINDLLYQKTQKKKGKSRRKTRMMMERTHLEQGIQK